MEQQQVEVVEQGTARYGALEVYLPSTSSWAQCFVVVDLAVVDAETWGPWVGHAVRQSSPAARQPTFVFYFSGRDRDAYDAAVFYARYALGRRYQYSSLPTLSGRPLDGTWRLGYDAVVARPRPRPTVEAVLLPALYLTTTTEADPEADPTTPEAYRRHQLRTDKGGSFAVREVALSYRGQDFGVALARARPQGLVFRAGLDLRGGAATGTGLPGSRSAVLTTVPDPAVT